MPRVALFVTCLADQFVPEVAHATVRVLRRCGCDVAVPPAQLCCGQPAYNSGHVAEARDLARAWLAAFAGAEYVVAPSGSCAGMVRHGFAQLAAGDPAFAAAAAALAARTFELATFLADVLGVRALPGAVHRRVAWHPGCHAARIARIGDAPQRLLAGIAGLELVDFPRPEDCCGFGGTFCTTLPAIAAAMADEKLAALRTRAPLTLVGADLGCLLHLHGRAAACGERLEVAHLAQILAEAMA
ncbi:MAG: (Fe-S)-binding protein [Planctomycetes bacterium]|nr:(Fe-S)-binding protein [Planctomycetota bacterium]